VDASFLDFTLFVRRLGVAERRIERIKAGKIEEAGIKLDGLPEAAKDDAFEVVVADFFGDPL
jgi:hypothetical protein